VREGARGEHARRTRSVAGTASLAAAVPAPRTASSTCAAINEPYTKTNIPDVAAVNAAMNVILASRTYCMDGQNNRTTTHVPTLSVLTL
jgi:hypothetical protein